MNCQKQDSHRPTAEVPTILQQEDEGVLVIIPRFMTELADILLRAANQVHLWIPSLLVDLLIDISFKTNVFK